MQSSNIFIRKVAVLGAGVMGAQIAAQFINAGMKAYLFDLPAKEKDHNTLVNEALLGLKNLHPAPLGETEWLQNIIPANYEDDLAILKECDWVIEVIAERFEWKSELYRKISPYLGEHTIITSNTSGLSITQLAKSLTESQQKRFCGVHFFNPPRYMSLIELIPNPKTDKDLITQIETFLVSRLGKNVIHAKDTPNFIANRIGIFSLLSTIRHADDFGISPDTVDALTGPLIGRPKSATFRTLDIVGLDTVVQTVNTMAKGLPNDPWNPIYEIPGWMQTLIQKGALGQKTKMGVYKKQKDEIYVIDPKRFDYRLASSKLPPEILNILSITDPKERFLKLRKSTLPEAKFLTACFLDLFHYSAYHLAEIAECTRDIDLALRFGFGWDRGPFEIWQLSGWDEIREWLDEEIEKGHALTKANLPEWVASNAEQGAYTHAGAFSPVHNKYIKRSDLPVYNRQLFPPLVLGERPRPSQTIFENPDVILWTTGNDLAILSFKTKHNTITDLVLEGIQESIHRAEQSYRGLILWQKNGANFSFGANLKKVTEAIQANRYEDLARICALFQDTALKLRNAKVPTIAAVRGLTLGGSCELMMHCSKTVAAFESYIGLVEVGVGILPAGGGTKEMALRATLDAKGNDPFPCLQNYFKTLGNGIVSQSAYHAKSLGFLRESDIIIMNVEEILYVAEQTAIHLSESNYYPSRPEKIMALGKNALATLEVGLLNLKEGEWISEHDYSIGRHLASVLCGGPIEDNQWVSECWFLELEQQAFMELLKTKKTQERIAYMLETGKPLRN